EFTSLRQFGRRFDLLRGLAKWRAYRDRQGRHYFSPGSRDRKGGEPALDEKRGGQRLPPRRHGGGAARGRPPFGPPRVGRWGSQWSADAPAMIAATAALVAAGFAPSLISSGASPMASQKPSQNFCSSAPHATSLPSRVG